MPAGKITKWIDDRGFGFISDDSDPKARGVFVHISALREAPNVGDAFSYDVTIGLDGRPAAVNVRPLTAEVEEINRVFG